MCGFNCPPLGKTAEYWEIQLDLTEKLSNHLKQYIQDRSIAAEQKNKRSKEMAGKFELYKDKAGEYRFVLKAGNGEITGQSEGYTAKSTALNGIKSVSTNAVEESQYDFKEGKNGKTCFNLKGNYSWGKHPNFGNLRTCNCLQGAVDFCR